ncbi:CKAP2 protein, partial [Rhinoptilus africanus]|nr:CKAP2 protein [Rhinoptilus africanus]
MAARSPPQLPASRRSEPAYREQRRQKVEEYLSRKKTFSRVPIQENEGSISSRTRRATTNKLQEKIQLSTSPKTEMENKENANKVSWDRSSGTSEKNVILNSSPITLTNSISGTNYNPEDRACKDEVTEVKSQHVSLSKSFLQIKSMKEKQLIAEKENSSVSLPKKPVLGTYRGKVVQSKINSFRKAPRNEEAKSSLLDKKLLPSATKPEARSLSTSRYSVDLKTTKSTSNPNSVKPIGVLPFQSKPSDKAAINSQSSLKKWQPTSAVGPKKATVQKMTGGRGSQPLKAASNNSDCRALGGKKCADFCEDARFKAPAKPISVVPDMKLGQESKTNSNRKSILPKESAVERRARLDEWRASRGKVMRRPPISVLLGPQSKSKEEISSGDSLEHVIYSEKVNKTLAECLQLTEQGSQGNKVRAMLNDLSQSTPGAKKLAKYWICCMHLEQMGPLEKLIAVYEEAILAGAMPKDELRRTLIDIMKNTESHLKSEDVLGETVTETHLSEVVEVSKEPNSSVEQVQETFKDPVSDDDQKAESDDKNAETSSEAIKEETDLDLEPREDILPKKAKKHKTKEHTKKKGKRETEEQDEDEVKEIAQAVNSPEKENDTSYLRCNPSTTPYVESVKMYHEANDSSAKHLKIVTPLRYSQRIREKMYKLSDTAKGLDPCASPFEQLGELESKATAFIHKQSNALKEASDKAEE